MVILVDLDLDLDEIVLDSSLAHGSKAEEPEAAYFHRKREITKTRSKPKPYVPKGFGMLPMYIGMTKDGEYYEGPAVRAGPIVCFHCHKHGDHWANTCPENASALESRVTAAVTSKNTYDAVERTQTEPVETESDPVERTQAEPVEPESDPIERTES
ncbi:uncharacterized protein LOC133729190 [Rosa rugosa]|uniref:uncharacterized protein LOC133729190 n=1 Tax=Rosa rugosa TaxID=74645 RepID=UPI002B405420|nr:uncharacterized protein LOC133729190 [Rosa rugosa]